MTIKFGIKGNCFCCKQEKNLPFVRDDKLICSDCENQIERDAENANVIECRACRRKVSPRTGRANSEGDFNCWNCLPKGICSFCGEEKRLPYVCGDETNGYYLFCKECHEQSELLEMTEN